MFITIHHLVQLQRYLAGKEIKWKMEILFSIEISLHQTELQDFTGSPFQTISKKGYKWAGEWVNKAETFT